MTLKYLYVLQNAHLIQKKSAKFNYFHRILIIFLYQNKFYQTKMMILLTLLYFIFLSILLFLLQLQVPKFLLLKTLFQIRYLFQMNYILDNNLRYQ